MTIGPYIAGTTTDAKFGLGDKHVDHLGRTWVYVQAAEALTQYDFVGIDEDYAASQLTATEAGDGWFIGVAQVAFSADEYGWIVCQGANGITARVAASCAADVALYTTATAGVVDDATTTTKIDGVVAVAANTTTSVANVEVLLTFPKSSGF
ncbi:MAG: hypothetical protein VX464_11700 [Pseudomonadota bacterium]|nr:hypothetical protein [Pseudomonadota bacterium]